MSEIQCPEGSFLETPHKVEGSSAADRLAFYELAKSRVQFLPREDYCQFEEKLFGDPNPRHTAMFVLNSGPKETDTSSNKGELRQFVEALDIKVNQDAFAANGMDYTDLIPYSIEHEIYEAWLNSKEGYQPKDAQTAHLLARRRQFETAMADGKAERLLEFCIKVNPRSTEEFQAAYNNALKKKKTA